ncbi:MAG: polyprenyl synthetase family protein [Firmicutes bacterium]|nr:polyprenyl synthetase family protein [Bacillota bacterium]
MAVNRGEFIQALREREAKLVELINRDQYRRSFNPEELREAVYSYLNRPAKRLRPGILLFSCGAVGGDEQRALSAAAAVEVYHTWTLVHDDIIDNDSKRRGFPTLHEQFRGNALNEGYSEGEAADYGRNMAILAGDLQHAWSMQLIWESINSGVSSAVVLDLLARLTNLTKGLLEGEALDVLFSKRKIDDLKEMEILKMLELKTGILYEFAGIVGASIGLDRTIDENNLIQAIGSFARKCGVAFQLQDDILGITGDEKRLGKPIGSDIREGKRTVIVLHAFQQADDKDRDYLLKWLGNPAVSGEKIEKIKQMLIEYNGVEYAKKMADQIVNEAIEELAPIPESQYKNLLLAWADYVADRQV